MVHNKTRKKKENKKVIINRDCGTNSLIVLLIQRMEITATKMKMDIINNRINGFICNAYWHMLLSTA